MIRSTKHRLSFSNTKKQENLQRFVSDYKTLAKIYLDFLWNNEIHYTMKSKPHILNIKNNQFDVPKMLSNPFLESKIPDFASPLSGRARKCCLTQVLGILSGHLEKQKKRLYQYTKTPNDKLLQKIIDNQPQIPNISNISNITPELNSICADFQSAQGLFSGFIQLKSIGKSYGKIRLPIKFHKLNKRYATWQMKPSFLVGVDNVDIRWEKEISKKNTGSTVGADQGLLDVLTLSDGQTTPKSTHRGRSLQDITTALSKCKKGSKRFKRKQAERKNFINWNINQLNLDNIKQINLEEVVNIRFKKTTNRVMSHWSNPLIRDKLKSRCEEHGVRVVEKPSAYNSQRCSGCGLVKKSHRKSKVYTCSGCGSKIDSDFNASVNLEQELPAIPMDFFRDKRNVEGFYWLETGFFDLSRAEIAVPLTKN